MQMQRFVVEVDGSPETDAAVRWCAEHATADDEVVVVAALSMTGEFVLGFPPSNLDYWRTNVRESLESRWVAPLLDAKIPVRTRLIEETPWKAVLEAADEEQADAIVMGQHRHRLLSGSSDMEKVIHHATRPVIVIPEAAAG